MSAGIEKSGLVLPLSVRQCNETHDDSSLCIVNAHDVIVAHSPHATRYLEPLQRMIDARNFDEISKRVNGYADLLRASLNFVGWFKVFIGESAYNEIRSDELDALGDAIAKAGL